MIVGSRERASRRRLWLGLVALLAIGALLRIWAYAVRGALWTDEAGLALNFVGRDVHAIARPFIYEQYAPYLYVISNKLVTLVLGSSEHALRFPSLITGLLLLPAIALLARRITGWIGALFALVLLVPNDITVLYASELKPYGQDALVATLLLLVALRPLSPSPNRARDLVLLAVAGALAPWFSLPSIFVLAAIGAALLVDTRQRKLGARAVFAALTLGAIWVGSFAAHYSLFLSASSKSSTLQDYWSQMGAFAPFPPHSFADVRWYFAKFFYLFSVFVTPLGFGMRYVAALTWFAGLAILWRRGLGVGRETNAADGGGPALVTLLVTPLPLCFVASALHKYIIADRLVLFMAPLLIVPVCTILSALFRMRDRRSQLAAGALAASFAVPALFVVPARLTPTNQGPDVARAVAYLQRNFQSDDRIYIETQVEWVYAYYAQRAAFDAPWTIENGYTNSDRLTSTADLKGAHRIWALVPTLGHAAPHNSKATPMIARAEQVVTERLNHVGHQIDAVDGGTTRLYLFELPNETALR